MVDLIELIGLLQITSAGISVDEISTRFEVCRRTAERMLGALRSRFPELEGETRSGRKYWRLVRPSTTWPFQLPREVEQLHARVAELEIEIEKYRRNDPNSGNSGSDSGERPESPNRADSEHVDWEACQ
jgi:hypothetical protein